jgi:hypothetical protein
VSLWLEPPVFPVLLDSCVLYPYELRDLLLEAAHEQLYRVHWSPQILEDTVRNLLADARTTFPEALVEPPSGLADQLGCDSGDRHVLAAAIAAKAEVRSRSAARTRSRTKTPEATITPLAQV